MLSTIIEFATKSCSTSSCSRAAMIGVICLSFWAVAHASDSHVRVVENRASITALSVSIEGVREEQARVREELEKTRKELKEASAEQTRRFERLETLLLTLLGEQRKRS